MQAHFCGREGTCVTRRADGGLGQAVRLVDGVAKVAQLYERVPALLGAVEQGVLKFYVPAHFE